MSEQSSSEQIVPGDVCVLVGLTLYSEYNGTEVTITGPLEWSRSRVVRTGEIYEGWHYPAADGYCYRPENLRKKKPPREDLRIVRWDECPWQPESLHA
jgi:hypothetical protein